MNDYQQDTFRAIMERVPEHRKGLAEWDAAQLALSLPAEIRHHVLFLLSCAAHRPEEPSK